VQSLDDRVLRTLGRAHDALEAIGAASLVQSAGLSLSIDLIYSVPGQDMRSWDETLRRAISLGPEHISAYELTLEKGTACYEWLEKGKLRLQSEDDAVSMYFHAAKKLGEAGFEHYEVSNYAKSVNGLGGGPGRGLGRRSMHNVNYWRRGEYLGLGASAHSFLNETRSANLREPYAYIEAIEQRQSPLAESMPVTPDEARREFLFLGLRMMEGINISEAASAYGIENIEVKASGLVRDGVFEIIDGRLRVSERAVPVMNAAVVALMRALGV
jgi:oxygen-independent coproporphyrinogen-3 oxidase